MYVIEKFKKLFKKQKISVVPPMPDWEEIVQIMYDKNLIYSDKVIQVIYSQDKTERFVILKSSHNFYTYHFEKLFQWDDEEWQYIGYHKDALPGMWSAFNRNKSIFGTLEEVQKEIITDPEYKHF